MLRQIMMAGQNSMAAASWASVSPGLTLSSDLLTVTNGVLPGTAGSPNGGAISTAPTNSKIYMEAYINKSSGYSGGAVAIGVSLVTSPWVTTPNSSSIYLGGDSSSVAAYSNGQVYKAGSVIGTCPTATTGDTLMLAYDAATGQGWVGVNGTWWSSGNPAAGTAPTFTFSATGLRPSITVDGRSSPGQVTGHFSLSDMQYAVPLGFSLV